MEKELLPECPNCGQEMTFIADGPREEPIGSGRQIIVPLASDIYGCPRHGKFRVYVSGAMKPYVEPSGQ